MSVMQRLLPSWHGARSRVCGGGSADEAGAPLYGLLSDAHDYDDLVRLDPSTLRPLGKRLDVGEYRTAWSLLAGSVQARWGGPPHPAARPRRCGPHRRSPPLALRTGDSARRAQLAAGEGWVGDRLRPARLLSARLRRHRARPSLGHVLGRRMLEGIVSHAAPTPSQFPRCSPMSPRTGLGPTPASRGRRSPSHGHARSPQYRPRRHRAAHEGERILGRYGRLRAAFRCRRSDRPRARR